MSLVDFFVFYCIFVLVTSALVSAFVLLDWLVRILRGKP
jgi:nitrate reductase NapE component